MTWMLSNWVERRASRDQHLANAAEVWRKAQAAVVQASDSLRRHYRTVAAIRFVKQSSDELVLAITPESFPRDIDERESRFISLKFCPEVPKVTLTGKSGEEQAFPIEADCDHAYIAVGGREILYDEFSRVVLEDAFFLSTNVTSPLGKQDPAAVLEYVNQLVRALDSERNSATDDAMRTQRIDQGAA